MKMNVGITFSYRVKTKISIDRRTPRSSVQFSWCDMNKAIDISIINN